MGLSVRVRRGIRRSIGMGRDSACTLAPPVDSVTLRPTHTPQPKQARGQRKPDCHLRFPQAQSDMQLRIQVRMGFNARISMGIVIGLSMGIAMCIGSRAITSIAVSQRRAEVSMSGATPQGMSWGENENSGAGTP